MNNRIKTLRKEMLKLSQDEFGSNIGMSRSNVANIEVGRIKLTERNIKDICEKYNVNEDWLRTGNGDPLIELLQEDEYTIAAAELSRDGDEIAMQAVIEYWKLDEDRKKIFRDFIIHIVENTKNKE